MISLRRIRLLASLLCTLLPLFCNAQTLADQNLHKFAGGEFPLPPQQNIPWNPPAEARRLNANFVSASASLFALGVADPRGCEYRQIEVTVGSVWGGAAAVSAAHGWVLPGGAAGHQFGIGWNGLVYPLYSVGKLADLRHDINAAIAKDEERRAQWAKERHSFPFYRFRNALPENYSLDFLSLLPLKSSLLLRLGEVELAGKVWSAWAAGMQPEVNDDALHLRDPFLMLATYWAWAMFERAVTAHMRGDDQLALLSARALAPLQAALEAEVDRRGLQSDYYYQSELKQNPKYLIFLKSVTSLLRDQERRANERQRNSAPRQLAIANELSKRSPPSARIMALIRDLDEVRAYQAGQPGGVDLTEDATVKALIGEGEEAVEPLLAVLENDQRLTRSVQFGRDFSYGRSILGVHKAAYVALTRILKTDFSGGNDLTQEDGRRAVAAEIRQYWKAYGETPIEERWYRILLDDHQSLDQWRQAAARIVELADIGELSKNVTVTYRVTFPWRPNQVFTLRGEALRQKPEPTVSQLLIRRMNEVIERKEDQGLTSLTAATEFATALATCDGANHLDELRQLNNRLQKMFADGPDLNRRENLICFIVSLYIKRHKIGDRAALPSYAEWLRSVKPEDAGDYGTPYLFALATQETADPSITRAIEVMFADPASPWFPLIQRDKQQSFHD